MKISCVVPVYNEAARIHGVLDILVNHELIDEVIVVNDGSSDGTDTLLQATPGIILITHSMNQGKTQAVLTGLKRATHPVVMLIDADLIGLSSETLSELIVPVLEGRADVAISIRKNTLTAYRLLGIDFVSGERVFHKDLLLAHEPELTRLPGFGLEVYMNDRIIEQKLRVHVVQWRNVVSPRKASKIGFFLGSMADLRMIQQIFSVITVQRCVRQIYQLRRLSR